MNIFRPIGSGYKKEYSKEYGYGDGFGYGFGMTTIHSNYRRRT